MAEIISFPIIAAFEHCEGWKVWIHLSVKNSSFAAMPSLCTAKMWYNEIKNILNIVDESLLNIYIYLFLGDNSL